MYNILQITKPMRLRDKPKGIHANLRFSAGSCGFLQICASQMLCFLGEGENLQKSSKLCVWVEPTHYKSQQRCARWSLKCAYPKDFARHGCGCCFSLVEELNMLPKIWARTQGYCKRGSGGQRKIEKFRATFWDSKLL